MPGRSLPLPAFIGTTVSTFTGAIANSGTITGTGGTAINISAGPQNMTVDVTGGVIVGNMLGAGLTSGDTLNFALGGGTFTYNSDFINFDTVNINSGNVVLNGAANSATAVNVYGTLAGTGTIDPTTVTIQNGGTLSPGNTTSPLGTFSIIGTLVFSSGSTYAITIAPGAGNNSKTAITGNAVLGGNGTVVVTPQLGHYNATVYQILTTPAPGDLIGQFAGLTINGAFSGTMTLDYTTNPGDVDLDISAVMACSARRPAPIRISKTCLTASTMRLPAAIRCRRDLPISPISPARRS